MGDGGKTLNLKGASSCDVSKIMLYLKRYRGDGTAVNVETISADAGGWVGVLPNMGYRGMCGPKGYGVSALLVINGVSILANFGHFGNE